MRLNANGYLARSYLFLSRALDIGSKRLPADLCTFFWGLVGRYMAAAMIATVPLALIVAMAIKAYQHPWEALIGLGVAAGVIALILILVLAPHIRLRRVPEPVRVAVEMVKAKKNRYCPRIEWR